MKVKSLEEICMQLITYSGAAKSSYVQAMNERREGNKEGAIQLLNEGQEAYSKCHTIHKEMFTAQHKLENSIETLLLMHAEDQMMSCETIYILAIELIECYNRIENLENKR